MNQIQAALDFDARPRRVELVDARAIRENRIRVAGYCARVRGNGAFGGKLYAPGRVE